MNRSDREFRFVLPVALLLLIAIVLCGLLANGASAQRMERLPQELEGVEILEHLNGQVPLDLDFTDETGQSVVLRDYFKPGRPILLSIVYYRCPMLCSLVLNGMVNALNETDLTPGEDFDLLTISFDASETPNLAEAKRQNYLREYTNPHAAKSWHFLVGEQASVDALTDAVGFRYKWIEERKEFAHQAAIYVLTPEGIISRYLYGVMFEPKTVRLTLIEASKGGIGSTLDKIILYCFHYDSNSGKYSLAARNLMRVGGMATILVLGMALSMLWRRESKRRRAKAPGRES